MSIREELLRAAAIGGGDEADIAVLADYYEQNGQPSRAAMWRDPERRHLEVKSTTYVPLPHSFGDPTERASYLAQCEEARRALVVPPDFTLTPTGPTDPRRNAMIWLLMQPGIIAATHQRRAGIANEMISDIATLFDLSTSMIRHVITNQDRLIRVSAATERALQTMRATQRLMAVGAIPTRNDDRARFVSYDRDQTQMTGIAGVGGVVADAPGTPGAVAQQVGVALDANTMTIAFGDDGWTERELYLSSIELPPDTWPHTGTIGIRGPKRTRIVRAPQPIQKPVSDLPLFERHGDRKDTTT